MPDMGELFSYPVLIFFVFLNSLLFHIYIILSFCEFIIVVFIENIKFNFYNDTKIR